MSFRIFQAIRRHKLLENVHVTLFLNIDKAHNGHFQACWIRYPELHPLSSLIVCLELVRPTGGGDTSIGTIRRSAS